MYANGREKEMIEQSQIAKEYLAAYRQSLLAGLSNRETLHLNQPAYHLRRMANDYAARAVPEGAECLRHYGWTTINKHQPHPPVDPYSATIGKQIRDGLAAMSLELIPEKADRYAHRAQPSTPPAQLPAPVHTTVQETAEPNHRNHPFPRPTKAELDDMLEKYTRFADTHDSLPGDSVLGHFTGRSPSTWATVRGKAEERGYQFVSAGSHDKRVLKVLARPIAAKAEPAPAPGDPVKWTAEEWLDWARTILAAEHVAKGSR